MEKALQVLTKSELLGHQFTIYGTADSPLFLAKEVADVIDHSKADVMVNMVDDDEKVKVNNLYIGGRTGGNGVWMLTEDGLYEVLMQSRKPIAKQFKKGVKVILKEIRKTGGYLATTPDDTPEMIMAKALKVADATMRRQDAELKAAKGTLAAIKEAIRESTAALEKANRLLYGEAEAAKPVAVDANALPLDPDAYTGSRWSAHGLRGASDLLEMRKIRCRVSKFNAFMVKEGYLEVISYANAEDRRHEMKCMRLTEEGKKFGRNKLFVVSGRYHPLYYDKAFTRLIHELREKGYEL
jgi:prophage antirepressor-like protein